MHYLFTVTFISPKGHAGGGYRRFLGGVRQAMHLPGVRVAYNSLCPAQTDDPPMMDDLLDRVKYSLGVGIWEQEPVLFNAFAVIEVDPIDGSLKEVGRALTMDMDEEMPRNVTWVPLEDSAEQKNYEELSADQQSRG